MYVISKVTTTPKMGMLLPVQWLGWGGAGQQYVTWKVAITSSIPVDFYSVKLLFYSVSTSLGEGAVGAVSILQRRCTDTEALRPALLQRLLFSVMN